MRSLVTLLSLSTRGVPPRATDVRWIFDGVDLCTVDSDCELPERCCKGLMIRYCCDLGGHHQRLRRPSSLLPNITLPPLPGVPLPSPVPEVSH